MSTKLFWNVLKLSPALLSAAVLVATRSYAQDNVPVPTAASSTSQALASVNPAVEPLTQQAQTTGVASNPVPGSVAATSTSPAVNLVKPAVTPASDQSISERTAASTNQKVERTAASQENPSVANPRSNRTDGLLAQQVPAADNTSGSSTEVLEQINRYSNADATNSLDQVTNVTQLSDVRPTDWAYEALRSLVERYGCIAGYPDGTFRGNRATSRYEFAAGLNACLQQVERLIRTSGEGFVTKQDLQTLQRLLDEFRTELTALGARVDKLEGRVAFLEDHQFSTTTKLNGEVIFALSDFFGDKAANGLDYGAEEAVFQDRVRLNFDTSFTGKDRLRTRLQAGNVTEFGALRSGLNIPGQATNITREGRFGFQRDNGNSIELEKLWYRFPLANVATAHIFANAGNYDDFVPLLNPGLDPSGTGAISRFGRYNPIYRIGQPSQSAGAGLTFGPSSPIRVDVGYLAGSGSANDPGEDAGVFNGSYSALGQVTFQPSKAFSVAATYVHAYSTNPDALTGNAGLGGALGHGTGSLGSQVSSSGANGRPVVSNSYGIQASFAFTPQLVLSGWAGLTEAIVLGRGDADVWNYAATLAINDFGTKGSTLGFVVGMEPKLTGTSGPIVANLINGGRRKDPDTGLHVEGFYKFRLTPNILITPGVIWLTAPGHNSDNDDIVIGTIRTTFTF